MYQDIIRNILKKNIELIFGNKVKNIRYFKRKLTDEDKKKIYIFEKIQCFIDNLEDFLPKEDEIKIIEGNISKEEILKIIKEIKEDIIMFFVECHELLSVLIYSFQMYLYNSEDLKKFPKEFQERFKKNFLYKYMKNNKKDLFSFKINKKGKVILKIK